MTKHEKFFPLGNLDSIQKIDQQAVDKRTRLGCKLGAFVAIFSDLTDRVLMVQLGDYAIGSIGGHPWTLPGGTVDENELPSCAVKRELEEESGIIVDENSLLPAAWIMRPYAGKKPNRGEITVLFAGSVENEIEPKSNPPEIRSVNWFEFDLQDWLDVPSTGTGHGLQPLRRHWIYWTHIAYQRRNNEIRAARLLYTDSSHMRLEPQVV